MYIKGHYLLHLQLIKSFFIFFLLIQFCVRLWLIISEYHNIKEDQCCIFYVFLCGTIEDICIFTCLLTITFAFLSIPFKKVAFSRLYNVIILFFLVSFVYLIATAEYFFWAEFHNRFNFIAIDYLIYTKEVIANIRESYSLYVIFSTMLVLPLITTFLLSMNLWKKNINSLLCFNLTILYRGIALCALAIFLYVTSEQYLHDINNQYLNEIAKNGYHALLSALQESELSYDDFYLQGEEKDLLKRLRAEIITPNSRFLNDVIMREIKEEGPEKRYNVMLIVVESLSAEFLSAFGDKQNLTPYLNDLVKESILFTNLYAVGIRTAYGLSALNLSIPPIPGHAIIQRLHNENLFSLGYILNSKGYESKFIQGGDSNFDNMRYFFSNNGYEVIDRSNFAEEEVTFSNAWGVCDEDLFNKVIRESNKSHSKNKPFFNMIATISNHTPFTYPDNKIDTPLNNKRKGAIKYTDYAIKQFIENAKTQAWFDNTIFVITADHTANSAGKVELDPVKYNIPMIIYAPKIIPTIDSSTKLNCLENKKENRLLRKFVPVAQVKGAYEAVEHSVQKIHEHPEVKDVTKQCAAGIEFQKESNITKYSGMYVDQLISQIDIAPTILGMLNMSYNSTFYGKNALKDDINRSFISNYQKLGYLTDKSLFILKPQKLYSHYKLDKNNVVSKLIKDSTPLETALCYFQIASKWRKFNSISVD